MPPTSIQKIQWNKVTWYSKILAILIFVVLVCGAFVFGTWYQKQLLSRITTSATILRVAPGNVATSSLSYSRDFTPRLDAISTADWKTYTSKYGYELKYPSTWSYYTCANDEQVFFYDPTAYEHQGISSQCESNGWLTDFSIIGPMTAEAAKPNASRLTEDFSLNGASAIRYINSLSGQTGETYVDQVTVQKGSEFMNLYLEDPSQELLGEKMLSTFRVTH